MALKFQLDHRRGSMLDKFGNAVVNTAVTLAVDEMHTGVYNGSSSQLNIDSVLTGSLASTTTGSFVAWVKPTDATPAGIEQVITFGDTNGNEWLAMQINTDGKLRAFCVDGGATAWALETDASAFTNEMWTHVTLVQNGTAPVFYVDGVAVAQTTTTSVDTTKWFNDMTALDNGRIGDLNYNSAGEALWFDGNISMTRIYDHALTQKEINADYKEFLASSNIRTAVRNFSENKPTDLSKVPNLVAAYNMIPNGTNLSNIQGDTGIDGTLVGTVASKDGVILDGVADIIKIDGATTASASDTVGTWMGWVKLTDATPASGMSIITAGDTNAQTKIIFYVTTAGLLEAFCQVATTMQWRVNTDAAVCTDNVWVHAAVVQDGVSPVLFVNGVAVAQSYITTTNKTKWFAALTGLDNCRIGSQNSNSGGESSFFGGEISDIKMYNTNLSVAQVESEYNEGARKLSLLESLDNAGADNTTSITPENWIVETGTVKIGELATADTYLDDLGVGTKYMEGLEICAAGTQSKQAYGTWEFSFYKGQAAALQIPFIGNQVSDTGGTFDGYDVGIGSGENIGILRRTSGGTVTAMQTANSYISSTGWYRIKVTRSSTGVFTMWIKGGSQFGDTYTLVDVSGGTGTNPATDNTHKTSEYFNFSSSSGAGDRITNIKLQEGIII